MFVVMRDSDAWAWTWLMLLRKTSTVVVFWIRRLSAPLAMSVVIERPISWPMVVS